MKLRQRQLSAPKPISAAALRQRLYARPGLFAPAARLTRDDVGQNFRPRIHSRATSLPLFLSICYASLPPPPISRYLCSASIALLRSPLLSSSSSPLLPSRKTVRLTKPGSRKLRGDNVGTTFLRVSSARGGKKRTSFSSRAHPWLGQTNFLPLPLLSLSLSLGLFQIKIARSSNGISGSGAGKSWRIGILVGGIGTSQRSRSLFDACTHYKSLRKEAPSDSLLPTPARIIASCSVRGGSKISTFTEMPSGEERL